MNKVVARFNDGRVVKGMTLDFSASRDVFHIFDPRSVEGSDGMRIDVGDLKALFYVKDFAGDSARVDKQVLACPPPAGQVAVEVAFRDGEVVVGTTTPYRVEGGGFYLVPADDASNNVRCFVPVAATRGVTTIC